MTIDPARQQEFEDLAGPLVDALYSTALRMTRQPDAAEDLVQDALLRAWRYFDRYESGTNFRAWLFRIMTNIFINQYRKAHREPPLTDLEHVDGLFARTVREHLIQVDHSPEDQVMQRVEGEVVRAAVDRLPDVFRIPVVLCDLQGLSYREIAETLEVPLGTVMSRIFRGRKQLYSELLTYAHQQGYVPKETGQ